MSIAQSNPFADILDDQAVKNVLQDSKPTISPVKIPEEAIAPGPTDDLIRSAFELLIKEPKNILYEDDIHSVVIMSKDQLPAPSFDVLMNEIGRLRELTFREIGEGTKKSRDTDIFDGCIRKLSFGIRKIKKSPVVAALGSQKKFFPYMVLKVFIQTVFFTMI